MKKFTLLELIIVISVLGILISLLLPSLRLSREKAKAAVCQSNQSQLGKGITSFATQNDLTMPNLTGVGQTIQINWRIQIAPYLGIQEPFPHPWEKLAYGPFKCPVANLTSTQRYYETGIGYNGRLGTRGRDDDDDGNWTDTNTTKFIQIEVPDETAMTGDGTDLNIGHIDHQLIGKWAGTFYLGDRHYQGINLLWADGHVSWKKKISLMHGKNGNENYYFEVYK